MRKCLSQKSVLNPGLPYSLRLNFPGPRGGDLMADSISKHLSLFPKGGPAKCTNPEDCRYSSYFYGNSGFTDLVKERLTCFKTGWLPQ